MRCLTSTAIYDEVNQAILQGCGRLLAKEKKAAINIDRTPFSIIDGGRAAFLLRHRLTTVLP